jgi:hypothetical protein
LSSFSAHGIAALRASVDQTVDQTEAQLCLSRYCKVTHGSHPRVGYFSREWVESVEDNVLLKRNSEEAARESQDAAVGAGMG